MGIGIAIICAVALSLFAVQNKRLVAYALLFLYIFFPEMGPGFTSFGSSFVFDQTFLNFYNFKFIEIVTPAIYIAMLFSRTNQGTSYLAFEKKLAWWFVGLILCLIAIEYFLHGNLTVGDFRLIISGVMLFHIFAMCINSEDDLISFVKVFIILLSIRALIGLVQYLIGHGVSSPRGVVPFFWDSRQIRAFGIGAIFLVAYLANFRALKPSNQIFSRVLAVVMLVVLLATVTLCMRRTVWFITILGSLFVIAYSKRIGQFHYILIGLIAMLVLTLILTLPGFKDFRARMEVQINSLNLFSAEVSQQYDNKVHIDNVKLYTQMIMENPSILGFGFRAYPNNDYLQLQYKYSGREQEMLGAAHNAILRSIYFYGSIGLLIYLVFYVRLIIQLPKVLRISDSLLSRQLALVSISLLFLELGSALTFSPPFYTTSKGLFYTFIAALLVNASLYFGAQNQLSANKEIGEDVDNGKDRILRRAVRGISSQKTTHEGRI
ncbi:MAG: hypothetical protein OEZ01_00015 [Candidatus Heimdallarchaeota archaeon]|nr:hypothetical protein [Candidatus Heimdallarchaeota archaeon]